MGNGLFAENKVVVGIYNTIYIIYVRAKYVFGKNVCHV